MIVLWTILVILVLFLVFDTPVPEGPPKRICGYSDESADYIEPKVYENVITDAERDYILQKAEPSFARSGVVGSAQPSDVRTSETAWIPKDDPVVGPMMKRICDQFGVPIENSEQLQVVRYKPGTYYREHHDSCCDDTDSCVDFAAKSGQRIRTILVYLNDDFTGGATHFPTLNRQLKAPPKGAVVFYPMSNSGALACHPKALHAGMPVESGTKYICNIWIRERPA